MPNASAKLQPPSLLTTAMELPRSMQELSASLLARPMLKRLGSDQSQPVMVLPGFGTGDNATTLLRRYIADWGYDSRPWEMGSNMNAGELETFSDVTSALEKLIDGLEHRLNEIYSDTGQSLSLVGWSLGGVISKILASRFPNRVRQVVTLGTPFGDPRFTSVYAIFQRLNGGDVSDSEVADWLAMCDSPMGDIPLSILYSHQDGFVSPHIATKIESATVENIRLRSSHVGFVVNPSALMVLADRLAQPEGDWKRYSAGDAIKRFF